MDADRNLATHFTWLQARLPGMRTAADEQLTLTDCGMPCDTFNAACRARLEPAEAGGRIAAALAWFRERAHPFSWWVGPDDRPRDLGRRLIAAGLAAAEGELAMALPLERLAPPAGPPQGFAIRRVTTASDLAHYAAINAANWTPPDPLVLAFYRQAAALALTPACPLRFYLGVLDGLPVAAAEMTVTEETVGLYGISTLAAYRGRGFGSAMTAWPLHEAARDGRHTAILQAAPDGVSIYRRCGFETYGEIVEYKP